MIFVLLIREYKNMPSDFTIQPHHSCMAQLMWPLATIEEYNTCQAVAIYALYAIEIGRAHV